MKIKCPACGAVGTDVEPIAPEHRGPHWKPIKGEEDYAFAVYGHEGARAVRKCLSCGGGVYVKLLPPRHEAIPGDRWQMMQRYFDEQMEATDRRLGMLAAEAELAATTDELSSDQGERPYTPRDGTGGVMDFEHAAQEAAYRQVQEWVGQLYGESASASDENPTFTLPIGVALAVQPFGDDGACLDLWAWPVGSQRLPDAAHEEMLRLNAVYRFGDLNLQQDGSVLFEHYVEFDGLTKERFSLLVSLLSSSSDEVGSALLEQFG